MVTAWAIQNGLIKPGVPGRSVKRLDPEEARRRKLQRQREIMRRLRAARREHGNNGPTTERPDNEVGI